MGIRTGCRLRGVDAGGCGERQGSERGAGAPGGVDEGGGGGGACRACWAWRWATRPDGMGTMRGRSAGLSRRRSWMGGGDGERVSCLRGTFRSLERGDGERRVRAAEDGAMGMSYELADAHVADMRATVWTLTRATFTGAAILLREKAAYRSTSFRVRRPGCAGTWRGEAGAIDERRADECGADNEMVARLQGLKERCPMEKMNEVELLYGSEETGIGSSGGAAGCGC